MRPLSAQPLLPPCALCQTCRAETLSDGWRLCQSGFAYLTVDGVVGVVVETQRLAPQRPTLPPLSDRVVWKT